MQQVPPPSAHIPSSARPQIHGLTGIRALAALWVVVHHFYQPLYALFPVTQGGRDYIESGFLGVEVFFVLSGFIIAYTYADQFEQFTMGTYKRFVLLRVARIYPVHLVTLLAVLVLVLAAGVQGVSLDFSEKYTAGNFLANVLVLQSVPPFSAWNGPAWSICAEFAAYLAFPLVALWVARIHNARAGLTAAATVLLGGTALMLLVVTYINPSPTGHELIWLRISTEFTAGALLYAGWRHLGPMQQGPWWDWVAVISVIGVVILLGVIGDGSPYVLATVPLIGVFVLACAGATGWLLGFMGSKIMIWGGKVSYSVYMTHFILLMAVGKILPWDAYVDSSLGVRLGFMAAYYLMIIIAGAACYYMVEEPARQAIRKTADAKKNAAGARAMRAVWMTQPGRVPHMQRTPRPTRLRRRHLTNGTIIALSVMLAGGIGIAVSQTHQARATAAETATAYEPAVTYTAAPATTEVAFLGDSFTVGTGASTRSNRWTTALSQHNQWIELNYGYGGTNYATAGTLKGGRSYADRLTDLIISQPDIVIVSSAGNNSGDDQTPGIEFTFQELREHIPDARIIATSPYHRAGDLPEAVVDFGDDVRQGVEAVGGEYLDIGHPLKTHPDAMNEDGVHPNDQGYELIADAVQAALSGS